MITMQMNVAMETGAGVTGRVLIVEDTDSVRLLVTEFLRRQGLDVFAVSSKLAARMALRTFKPDVMILDLGLEDGEGIELMDDWREAGCHCLVLSARAGLEDRLSLLELGADDYVTKPFDPRELYLRIRNMLANRTRASNADELIVDYAGIRVVLATRSVLSPAGEVIDVLGDSELLLIRALSRSFPAVVSRQDLYATVFDRKSFETSRALDVLVSKLRRKLRELGTDLDIRSVRGTGYMLVKVAAGQ